MHWSHCKSIKSSNKFQKALNKQRFWAKSRNMGKIYNKQSRHCLRVVNQLNCDILSPCPFFYVCPQNQTIMGMVMMSQGRRAAFGLWASNPHLESDNKISPTKLKANFCTFSSILYKTAGKSVIF